MKSESTDWQSGTLKVDKNDNGDYSIWPIDRENPLGWQDVGKTGSKEECLEYIKENWTSLTPK